MSDRTSKHVTNFAGDCASTCPACSEVVKAQQRLRAALSLVGECLSRGYWKIGTELTQRANAAIIEALSGDSPSPVETTVVPLTELQECLASEGAKDYRIEALEAALDWALPAVFEHYTEGEAPKVAGAYEEIEKGRARVLAELERLRTAGSPVEPSPKYSSATEAANALCDEISKLHTEPECRGCDGSGRIPYVDDQGRQRVKRCNVCQPAVAALSEKASEPNGACGSFKSGYRQGWCVNCGKKGTEHELSSLTTSGPQCNGRCTFDTGGHGKLVLANVDCPLHGLGSAENGTTELSK